MTTSKLIVLLFVITVYLTLTQPTLAEGELSIEPGKYKLSKTTKTSFDSVPVTRTAEECITDPDLDPESILPSKDNCKIQNMKTANNQTSFDFICTEPGNKSGLKGYAEYSAVDNTISSKIKLEGTYKGKELVVESSGTGERIGDCVPETQFYE